MSPDLAAVIDAARDLAWQPTANLGGRRAHLYRERYEAAQRLAGLMEAVYLGPQRDPALACLLAAIARVSRCSFANRYGIPYYERKVAVAELRGCLVVFDREATA